MYVTIQGRELLPRVFTLTPLKRSGLFSVALSVPGDYQDLPVRKRDALCCPDFPPHNKCEAIERLAFMQTYYKKLKIGNSLASI